MCIRTELNGTGLVQLKSVEIGYLYIHAGNMETSG